MSMRPVHSPVRRPYRLLTLECLEDRCQPSAGELRRLAVPVAVPLAAPRPVVVMQTPQPTDEKDAPAIAATDEAEASRTLSGTSTNTTPTNTAPQSTTPTNSTPTAPTPVAPASEEPAAPKEVASDDVTAIRPTVRPFATTRTNTTPTSTSPTDPTVVTPAADEPTAPKDVGSDDPVVATGPTATTRLNRNAVPEVPTSDSDSDVDPKPSATSEVVEPQTRATLARPRPTAADGTDSPPTGPDETSRSTGGGSVEGAPISVPVAGLAGADLAGGYSAATGDGSWERATVAGTSATQLQGASIPSSSGGEPTTDPPALAAASWPLDPAALEAAVQRFLVGLDEVGQAVVRVVDGLGWAPTVTAAATLMAAYEMSRRRGRKDRPAFIGPDPLAAGPV
jgi:hypothetical protein